MRYTFDRYRWSKFTLAFHVGTTFLLMFTKLCSAPLENGSTMYLFVEPVNQTYSLNTACAIWDFEIDSYSCELVTDLLSSLRTF